MDYHTSNKNHCSWLKLLQQHRAIAVIRSSDYHLGINMARAVAAGGIRLIEVTWNSQQPAQLISHLRVDLPECIIGAGTLLTMTQLNDAITSGAEFLFSPHVNVPLIERALAAEIPIIPGALSPTEIVTAWQAGASSVKIFPAQCLGGAEYIKSLQAPLGHIPLIPTGGVNLDNIISFFRAGAIAVGLSSELFPSSSLYYKNWSDITQRAKNLVQHIQEYK